MDGGVWPGLKDGIQPAVVKIPSTFADLAGLRMVNRARKIWEIAMHKLLYHVWRSGMFISSAALLASARYLAARTRTDARTNAETDDEWWSRRW